MTEQATTIPVRFTEHATTRSYEVVVGSDLLPSLGQRATAALAHPPRHAFVIADDKVPADFITTATNSLIETGSIVTIERITALETNKTISTVERLLTALTETRADRSDPVVAIGGGITGDIAGFVAASYKRGVPVIQSPTTLLSMVDASVGGKTGVNLATSTGLKKNIVGAFWQPSLVLADLDTLASLPPRVFRAGLGECLKHALLHRAFIDEELAIGKLLEPDLQTLNAALARKLEWVRPLVEDSVRIKAAVVAADEREESTDPARSRAILNLGHTFAHAIETLPGLMLPDQQDTKTDEPGLHHGEAVFLGLNAAAACAVELGLLAESHANTIRQATQFLGMPTTVAGLPENAAILEAMGHDKKASAGKLRLILPVADEGEPLGRCMIVTDPPAAAITVGLDAI
ncbi:MAG: 3-dehydroquinate synthase family protein [Phycisphaerales bacterium JB050]